MLVYRQRLLEYFHRMDVQITRVNVEIRHQCKSFEGGGRRKEVRFSMLHPDSYSHVYIQ